MGGPVRSRDGEAPLVGDSRQVGRNVACLAPERVDELLHEVVTSMVRPGVFRAARTLRLDGPPVHGPGAFRRSRTLPRWPLATRRAWDRPLRGPPGQRRWKGVIVTIVSALLLIVRRECCFLANVA
ncbi:hypothetical protein MXAN_2940 [Myxococcus xanthus DK 1622]|uniref:Uncharacterized protein n=1 Tax=Myxococcus xanthus (strain DK1622) TaxID=246197 RepID=Q1D873_MYXXD|nr:hypothetical protein MXAN_2940 [Myxococcus xanthus DK 1622]